jgi:hypothetical protein
MCMGKYPKDLEFLNSEDAVMFLDPKLSNKSDFKFVLHQNLLNKTEQNCDFFLFDSRNRRNFSCIKLVLNTRKAKISAL